MIMLRHKLIPFVTKFYKPSTVHRFSTSHIISNSSGRNFRFVTALLCAGGGGYLSWKQFSPRLSPVSIHASASTAPKQTFADVVEKVAPSVVTVIGEIECTGIFVDSNGFIITSATAIDVNKTHVEVVFLGSHEKLFAQVMAVDKAKNLCLIKVDPDTVPSLPSQVNFSGDEYLRRGEPVAMITSGELTLPCAVSAGVVSSLIREKDGKGDLVYIVTDAKLMRGSLGSPLLNQLGQAVGVTCRSELGQTLIMPAHHVDDFISMAIKKAEMVKILPLPSSTSTSTSTQQKTTNLTQSVLSWFDKKRGIPVIESISSLDAGLLVSDVGTEEKNELVLSNASYRKLVPHNALLVLDVVPQSPASQAGIMIGDVIIEIDQRPVLGKMDSNTQSFKLKTQSKLTVLRSSKFHLLKCITVDLQEPA